MAASPSVGGGEKKPWWLTNKRVVERYVREAKMLIASEQQREIVAALGFLEAALALSPRLEEALELKARCLLQLRRFKEVGDMLQDYIPSYKLSFSDDASSSDNSSNQKLLVSSGDGNEEAPAFKCFPISEMKKKLVDGLRKNVDKGQWRYSVLGQACCHLGLMEDAMVLLQSGKRIATAASRRESISLSDDRFSSNFTDNQPQTPPRTESERISDILSHIKLLVRRKTAAIASLDAGLHSEAIRHFTKIVDGRRAAPQRFLSECYVQRAAAYRSCGRITEAIADCNRALALDTSCIDALTIRAALFESIRCLQDSLHDLEHLKLLYNSILRDKRLPGPVWKRQSVEYREVPGKLCSITSKMQQLKQKVVAGETGNIDYYALIGLKRGCSRSELERAHLLLTLKHRPDKSLSFIERCEFADEQDSDVAKERAKMSALLLYRLIQKGYTSVMASVLEEATTEKQRKKASAAVASGYGQNRNLVPTPAPSVFQGIFCRDMHVVGNLLSQTGFNRRITVKYEALSC